MAMEKEDVGTDLLSAKTKTPAHVAYEPAIALFLLSGIVVAVRQVIVSARHGGVATGAGSVPISGNGATVVYPTL